MVFCLYACTDKGNSDTCGSTKTVVFSDFEPQCGYFLRNNPEAATNVVIDSQAKIDSLFIDSRATVNCFAPSGSDFDLDKNTYLAVFAGAKPTGGYAIRIQSIKENDCEIIVGYYEKEPKAGEVVTQAITHPVDYAVIPKTTKKVVFKKQAYSGDYVVIGSYAFYCAGPCPAYTFRLEVNATARLVNNAYQTLPVTEDLYGFLSHVPQEVKDLKGQTKEYINTNIADGGGCFFEYHQEGVVTKVSFTNFYSTDKKDSALIAFKDYIYERIAYLNGVK